MERPPNPVPEASEPGEVTGLLIAWTEGDQQALDRLIPLVYDELHRLARLSLNREGADHTLQPTAVVHEAYLRLVDQNRVSWKNRGHFFAVAARTMRRLLVDHARRRDAGKRGGGATRISLDSVDASAGPPEPDVISLDRALDRLAELDARQAKVVELRYFGGLTLEETADVLGASPSTVSRAFRLAKAWLYRELSVA